MLTAWSHWPGGTQVWLGIERWQLCLLDTFRSAKCHGQVAVGHWVSLGWLIVYQLQLVVAYYLYPVANTVRPSVDMGEIITPA